MEEKKRKLLIVDDEPEIVNTLKTFFSVKGYAAIGASCGEEALRILEREAVDLILLDIRMPGLKGTEVAKIIKEKYPSVKIIIMSGYLDEVQSLPKDNILDAVFTKPVRLHELYSKLSELLTPREDSIFDVKKSGGIKARILLIKARLFFLEPSVETSNFLNESFRKLSERGEDYELSIATGLEGAVEKLTLFEPDLIMVNTALFKEFSTSIEPKMLDKNFSPKEIIIYKLGDGVDPKGKEVDLEKLIKSVETTCLKNGLIDVGRC